jgi:hypothetical protein
MAKKKDSNAKKIGRFVANEMLGVDDAKRAFNKAKKGDIKGAIKSAATAAFEAGTTVSGAGLAARAGAKIGMTAGKAAARTTSKKVGKEVLKSSNKAKGSGSMVYPKPAMGKKTATAPKRDVVVKTDDKVIPIKDKGYISKTGEKSIKTNTKKPTVRVVEKEVTRDMANMRTAQSNRLRYGNAKADAARARDASVKASKKPAVGKAVGGAAGAAAGAPANATATAINKKNKKKK